jgi:hypothetical protein
MSLLSGAAMMTASILSRDFALRERILNRRARCVPASAGLIIRRQSDKARRPI